jgi:putative transposase
MTGGDGTFFRKFRAAHRSKPGQTVSDIGAELTRNAIRSGARRASWTGTSLRRASRSRTPSSRASTARWATKFLNETLFFDLDDARIKIAAWGTEYNEDRPQSSLKYPTAALDEAASIARRGMTSQPARLAQSTRRPWSLEDCSNFLRGPKADIAWLRDGRTSL